MAKVITPVLLAGGSGMRLWPLSRKSYPKQFSSIIDDTSLFQQSALRLISSKHVEFQSPITMTTADFRFIVGEQLQGVGIEPGPILIEPEGRNTAPAILAASTYAFNKDPEAILLVSPSDHVVSDVDALHHVINNGLLSISEGKIVTFGITPTRAETGYGYLELSMPTSGNAVALSRFVEKPDVISAQKMLEAGTYLWNSGIFMFRAVDMIEAFERHAPGMLSPVRKAIDDGNLDLDFLRLDPVAWGYCENISIDYGIMEHAENLVVIPFSSTWSDLGNWDAVWHKMGPDKNGVATSANAHAIDCKNTLLRSESDAIEIVGLGLKDIVAVAMSDAVLVAHNDRVQDVKTIIAKLRSKNIAQAEIFPKDYRPWGWFEIIANGKGFKVKRIFLKPGASISLQKHLRRSEHWIIVAGTAQVTVNDDINIVKVDQSVYVPIGATHRIENPTEEIITLIEVQIGSYLGEDDIVRYEDVYARQ